MATVSVSPTNKASLMLVSEAGLGAGMEPDSRLLERSIDWSSGASDQSRGNQLSGTLPPLVAPHLIDLIVANNKLTGTVPNAIYSLPHVYRVDLGGNRLTGKIPAPTDATLPLRMLFLDNNQLTGSLPVLTSAQQILVLDISDNQLSGSVPLFGLSAAGPAALEYAARYLSLDASYGCAMDIDFADNPLTGALPSWLLSFPLEDIDASNCSFSEALPDTAFQGAWLKRINFSFNRLSGSISNALTSFAMQGMQLANNSLTGTLPVGLAGFTSLDTLDVSFNSLTGQLPEELGTLGSLDTLIVQGSGLASGRMQNSLKQYLPSWLQFDM
ncbi:hypothetical protein ABBQ38_010366 [Trebouxia sp. C0009 RCD-2024]